LIRVADDPVIPIIRWALQAPVMLDEHAHVLIVFFGDNSESLRFCLGVA